MTSIKYEHELSSDASTTFHASSTKPTVLRTSALASYLEWHLHGTTYFSDEHIPQSWQSERRPFGKLHVDIPVVPITIQPLAIVINVDRSGSMCDICADGRSKMQHIQHTLKNLMRVLSKYVKEQPWISVKVCLLAFSHEIENMIQSTEPFIDICPDHVAFICEAIDHIDSWGVTNIEKSLKYAQEVMQTYRDAHTDHRVIHIQLTDGEATAGSNQPHELQTYLDNSYKHIFIGVGESHDSYLLNYLAEGSVLGEYRFIDQLEKSGWICGEILYDILYPYYPDAPIHIMMTPGSLIYNWRINEWVSHMVLPPWSGNRQKDFHVTMENTDNILHYSEVTATIYSGIRLLDQAVCLPELLDSETNELQSVDLTNYLLRQRTQEWMYRITQYNLKQRNRRQADDDDDDEKKQLKEQLSEHVQVLKTASNRPGQSASDREFIQNLIDDIQIVSSTLGTERSHMYTTCRQTSQGSQYTYSPTGIRTEPTTVSTMEYNNMNITSCYSNMDMLSMMTQVQEYQDENEYAMMEEEINL